MAEPKNITRNLVIFLVLGLIFFLLLFVFVFPNEETKDVNTFEECVAAGYPVMESYPRQCSVPDGEIFVENIDEFEFDESEDYYGSSTNYPCESAADCVTCGCNSEICRGVQEGEMASICIYPEEPLPQDLGYSCGCFEGVCQWGK